MPDGGHQIQQPKEIHNVYNMASSWIPFLIIMGVALAIGGIATGTYVAVENKKPENKDKPVSAVTITFMMLTSALAGLVTYGGYTWYTSPTPKRDACPNCIFNTEDLEKYNKAVTFLNNFNDKVEKLPRTTINQVCMNEPCMNQMSK